jgi:hypothetical protein
MGESHAMTEDEIRLLEDFHKPDFELRQRDSLRYGPNVTVLRRGRYCTQCERQIPEDYPTALNIMITDRDEFGLGPDGMQREFCTWECAADWFEVRAGRRAGRVLDELARMARGRRAEMKP